MALAAARQGKYDAFHHAMFAASSLSPAAIAAAAEKAGVATDGSGDALAMIALYDDQRIEVRLIRGGAQPVYAIFDLRR